MSQGNKVKYDKAKHLVFSFGSCICVLAHSYPHICTYAPADTSAHIHIPAHLYLYTHMLTHIYLHMCTSLCTHKYPHEYTCTCTYSYAYTCTRIPAHKSPHAYTCTFMYSQVCICRTKYNFLLKPSLPKQIQFICYNFINLLFVFSVHWCFACMYVSMRMLDPLKLEYS